MIEFLNGAMHARIHLRFDEAGKLHATGPRTAVAIVEQVGMRCGLFAYWLAEGRVTLDWHEHAHLSGDPRARCRYCHKPTPLLDDDRQPCHKVCAETQVWRRLQKLIRTERRAAA